MHLYTKYQKWRTERQALRKNLRTGIRWQRQAEKKWLAELLANEQRSGAITLVFERHKDE